MRAIEFINLLVEGYKEVEAKFIKSGADAASVKQVLNSFRELVNKNQVLGHERNIDWWGKNKSFDEFSSFVNDKLAAPTKTQLKRKRVVGKSIFVKEDDNWLIVIPLDKQSSCFYGKNSSWCTTIPNQNHFENYFYRNDVILIYCLNKKTGGMWAIAGHKDLPEFEIFNKEDDRIGSDKFTRETGLNAQEILSLAVRTYGNQISTSKSDYKTYFSYLEENMPGFTGKNRDLQLEKALIYTKAPYYSHYYIRMIHDHADQTTVDSIPHEIVLAAINYVWQTITYVTAPTQQMLINAVSSGKMSAFRYIVEKLKINPPNDKIIETFLLSNHAMYIDDHIELLNIMKIPLNEKIISKTVNDNINAVYFFLRYGYKVSDDSIIKLIHESPNSDFEYFLETTNIFKNVSDKVKMALIHREPNSLKYFDTTTEELRIRAYKRNPGLLLSQLIKGYYPSEAEQRVLSDEGVNAEAIENNLREAKYRLTRDIKFYASELKRYKDNIITERESLAELVAELKDENAEWKKTSPQLADHFVRAIEFQKNKIKGLISSSKQLKKFSKETKENYDKLTHGEQTIGIISRNQKAD